MNNIHDYTKYFKEKKGLVRFIEKLYQKYVSFSHISGIVKLEDLSESEAIDLSRLFGQNFNKGTDIKISIAKFKNIMACSKFTDFDIEILVSEFMNEPLITKKELKENKNNKEKEFYQNILKETPSKWLSYIVNSKSNPWPVIHRRYLKNPLILKQELISVIKLSNNIPVTPISLPIYAMMYTTDPHYLDLDNSHINLFLYSLAYLNNCKYPLSREEKIYLLEKNNIIIDTISNFVITYNILSDDTYINSFSKNKESLILNIQNIMKRENFQALNNVVFIFENPSLLAEIIDLGIDVSVIITSGNPNLSVYLLMDKLVKNKTKFYYNGDYDPEGLIIADKLAQKYENLELFCYQKDDYENCLSSKNLEVSRLNKMNKIKTDKLKEMVWLIERKKKAGYQESNKNNIINFIKHKVKKGLSE